MRVSKKIMVIMIVLVIGLVYIINKSSNNKNVLNNKQEEPKVREKMAIKVENDNGDYVFASSFPGAGYVINNEKTECVDQAGNKVDGVNFSSDGTSVTVTSKYTAYCTLYFSKCKGPVGTVLDGKSQNQITSCPVGGMYRYQGTDNVNNWICFGTSDKTTCTKDDDAIDKYMYRIIGITDDGQLALIKETFIKEGSTIEFEWDDKYFINYYTRVCGADGSGCTWEKSNLYNRLNGLCTSTNENCSGTGAGTSGQTNIFIGNSYYEYLSNSTWLNKISDHEWKYGDSTQLDTYNGDNAYAIENAFTNSIEAKIGLQYVHDYYYAYPGGAPENEDLAKTAWIHFIKDGYINEFSYEWFLSRYGVAYGNNISAWYSNSNDVNYSDTLGEGFAVRPVFYLKSDIQISNTAGSKDDPFIITN